MIELLVVLAIIAILSSIVMISIRNAAANNRDARRMVNLNEIFKALALYNNQKNIYPIYDGPITSSDQMSTDLESEGLISNVPTDPLAGYTYTYTSLNGTTFTLKFCLETTTIKGYSQGCAAENKISP